MTMGEEFAEPLINAELGPPPITSSILVHADNYGAVNRPLSDGHGSNPMGHEPERGPSRWLWSEIQEQCWLSLPIMAMYGLQFVMVMSGITFVGHLGAFSLSAVSLANSFCGMTGYAVLVGLASALETLCGQAYGAKQFHLLGIYLQRAFIILVTAGMPICLIWLNMERILLAMGQDPEIVRAAYSYTMWLIPTLLLYAIYLPLIKFFQTQRAVFLLLISSIITVCFHVPLCWFIIDKLNLGFLGAAYALDISVLLQVVCLCAFVRFAPRFTKTFESFTSEAFQDFGEFFRLAIPSATMMCLEHWTFEILTMLSGLLPNSKLNISTFAICMGFFNMANVIATAFGVAASVRVSNELGAGKPNAARSAVGVSLVLGLMEGTVMASLIFSLRNVWGWAFSNDEEVVHLVSHIAPYLAVLAMLYSFQAVLSGVVRGIGWQRLGAFANLGAYYIVGLPVAVVMAFVFHWDGQGLWIGMGCGLLTQAIALVTVILRTNWEKLAQEALLRSNSYAARLPTTAPLLIEPLKDDDDDASDLHQVSAAAA